MLCSHFHKDNVRHDNFRFFEVTPVHCKVPVNVFESIFPQGKEYGRADRKY